MADSLDDLLDEVEARFCPGISLGAFTGSSCTFKAKQDSHKHHSFGHSISGPHDFDRVDSNIEAVLQEILDDDDDDYPASTSHRPILKACAIDSSSQAASKKCCPVYVGGSAIASGVGTSVTQRACDQLRCTSCDFRVALFDDQEWDTSCDYLFFRNNMPDCNKLRLKLKRRQGARAYACQCSWHSAFTLSELGHVPKLKWVCGQHTAC